MATIIDSYTNSTAAIVLGYSGASFPDLLGQSFKNTTMITLDSCKFKLLRLGESAGDITAKLYAHSGTYGSSSVPTGAALATSDGVSAASITTSDPPDIVTFSFTGENRIILQPSTYYVIAVDYTIGTTDNYLYSYYNASGDHGGNMSKYVASAWSAEAGSDLYFEIYGVPFSSIAGASSITGISSLQF